jgi:stage III sporulation protein AD
MELIKVIGVGIIGAVIAVTMKNWKNEFSVYIVLATGMLILIYALSFLNEVITAFNGIVDKTNIDSELFSGILKIIGIGYITEYSHNICTDCNAESIGNKIELCGKITIFLMALPIITTLVDVLIKFIA